MRLAAIAFALYGKLLTGRGGKQAQKYTVGQGDTLAKIAARHRTTVWAIKQANKLKDDLIMPGRWGPFLIVNLSGRGSVRETCFA